MFMNLHDHDNILMKSISHGRFCFGYVMFPGKAKKRAIPYLEKSNNDKDLTTSGVIRIPRTCLNISLNV